MKTAARLSARRRHPLAFGLVLFIGLSVTGGLYAALSTGSASAASTDATPQQVTQGKQIFLEGCSSCHGINAQGTNTVAPPLVGVGRRGRGLPGRHRPHAAAAERPLRQGKPVIYTQEQIDAIAAYIASLAPGPAIPAASQYDTSGADLQEGGELFRTNCAQCHNFAGNGGALTDGKAAPSLADATPKQIYEAMLTGPGQMPVFSDTVMTERRSRTPSSTSRPSRTPRTRVACRSAGSARCPRASSSGSSASASSRWSPCGSGRSPHDRHPAGRRPR